MFAKVQDKLSSEEPEKLDIIRKLHSNMLGRSDRSKDLKCYPNRIEYPMPLGRTIIAFCDLIEYGKILFSNNWQNSVRDVGGFSLLATLIQIDGFSIKDDQIIRQRDEIIEEYVPRIPKSKKGIPAESIFDIDFLFRLKILYGSADLEVRLQTLLAEKSAEYMRKLENSRGGQTLTLRFKYDALISYRRTEPDREFALNLFNQLEEEGYKIAFDDRDFAAHVPFLHEMERCVKESRFTIAVISPRFIESGNTEMETRIRTVLDMSGRTFNLIPVIMESTEMPTWLYSLSSVNYYSPSPIISPYQKLKNSLGNPDHT